MKNTINNSAIASADYLHNLFSLSICKQRERERERERERGRVNLIISLMLFSLFSAQSISGQYIKTSSQSQSTFNLPSYNSSTVVQHSGCDIDRTDVGGIKEVLAVAVWDSTPGPNNLMGWSYDDGLGNVTTDLTGLPADSYDPDVAIIRRGSATYFAIVGYYDVINGGVYAAVYEFTVSTLTWSSPSITTLATTNTIPTAVNVDTDDEGNFAIVWDETVSGTRKIHIAAGSMQGSPLTPTFCVTNYTLPNFNNSSGSAISPPYSFADVALYYKNGGPSVAAVSFLAEYVSGVNRQSIVMVTQDLPLTGTTSICNTNLSTQNALVSQYSSTSEVYLNPRLARHKSTSSYDQLGFTVVFACNNDGAGKTDIAGITTFQTGSGLVINGLRIYTNNNLVDNLFFGTSGGSAKYLPAIDDKINTNPVVSYERRSGSNDIDEEEVMAICFDHFDGTDNYPLSFYAQNGYGTPFSDRSPFVDKYYQIPTSPTGDEKIICVAGEESRFFLYCWWDATTYFTYFKIINAKSNLRWSNYYDNS